ncbi:AHH domain-containing protein [Corallococcus terminator]|uniref:Uncharacterized protein n=1 Tax=Corallococcus terminator TaxID=2316733 RepID=A0A3A8HKZ8_9BACT|nr:AHH domain-containing protein [Corallococcus terminator]RKG72082.1 hypothetical protein D7V88_38705 [Corallococcus terminator]
MAQSAEHITQMTKNDLHDKGACILRHESARKSSPCDYQWNGYQLSKTAARSGMYNKPLRRSWIDRDKADRDIFEAATRKEKRSGETSGEFGLRLRDFVKKYRLSVRYTSRVLERDPKAWFIGEPTHPKNFVPMAHDPEGGMHRPYYHNWHHMIPNGAINEYIGGGPDGAKRLFLLMTSLYNMNCGQNIVLLPKESFVGRVLGLPIHCPYGQMSHPTYSQACEKHLRRIAAQLKKVLASGNPHKLNDENVTQIKKAMNLLSDKLLATLKAMPPGVSLDELESI